MNSQISIIGSSAEFFIELTIEEIRDRYLANFPWKSSEDFYNEVISSLSQSPNVSGDSAIRTFVNALEQKIEINTSTLPLICSAAYCLQAKVALLVGEREKAWSCIAEARYWCGSILTKEEINISVEGIVKATNKNKAKNAAKARHEQIYGAIKNTVFELAINLMPASGWRSRRNASMQIFEKLKSNKKLAPLSEAQGQITIEKWLKDMPNSESLFSRKS